MRRLSCLLLIAVMSVSAVAGKKNAPTVTGAPIPEKVIAAKTVMILVTSNKPDYYYKVAYKYLADWDRWKIVTDPKAADLVLKITNREEGSFGMGSGSAFSTGGYTSATGMTVGVPLHHFYLSVIDPGTGEALWSTDTDERVMQSQNAKRMLKKLQERIAETERASSQEKN